MTDHATEPQAGIGPTAPPRPAEPHEPAQAPLQPQDGNPSGQPQPGPVNFSHYGEQGIQAYNLHLNGEQVIPVPITETDPAYKASQEGRFVPPRTAEPWAAASKHLDEYGIVVLCAPPGTGRRTAAVRLLRTVTSSPLALFELDPEWSKPSVQPLPKDSAAGYVLDLSDLPEEPEEHLGSDFVRHGEDLRKKGSFLVILATPADWFGHWAEPTLPFTVRLESPDAKALVTAELTAHHRGERVTWLNETAFTGIWEANPSARAAWRLAGKLIQATDAEQIQAIITEFGDWHTDVERLLRKDRTNQSDTQLLSIRVTVWAGALLHGGQRSSVIRAADDLLTRLGLARTPANVLTDATTTSRLTAAEITSNGNLAFHDAKKDGLPSAILRHLWDEFPTQHELLRSWATGIAADRIIPEEDARLVTEALLRLAVDRHERTILDGLADDLVGARRWLAVEALTEAADDAELGRYVRDRLRTWMDARNPSEAKVELVIEICGGTWGIEHPALALTRLGKAAGRADYGSVTLANAFRELTVHRPAEVHKALGQWLSDMERRQGDANLRRQTLGAFLALISSGEGTGLILDTNSPETRLHIVHAWQKLLLTNDAVDVALLQLKHWHQRFEDDPERRERLLDVLADIFTPPSLRPRLDRLMVTEEAAIHPFWTEVLVQAATRYQASKEESSP
ncbi:hypothetical protein [Streptomyces tibetensis]|uniref:hypothetical protein n=1 Tax=Streptomyces tibetensis TaxID=2382123 RepID=UPI0033C672E8